MEVKKGYKQTDLGVIPEDWDFYKIQYLIDSNYLQGHLDGNHGDLYPRSHEFKEDGVPYISANDFVDGALRYDGCKYLSKERASTFRKGVAKNGDVLFAHNATVGPTALLTTAFEYVILSTTATYFRCNPVKLLNTYLLYSLKNSLFIKQYQSVMAQSTRNQVPITAQRKFFLHLPPTLAEQTAIATALSDADALIQSLEKLIAKKLAIKQGAMQKLLKPKEDWVVCCIIDIVEKYIDYRGRTPKKLGMDWGNGNILTLSANNVQMGKIDTEKEAHLGSHELYNKWMVQGECSKGDVLLTMEAPLGNVAQIPDEKKYILSQRVVLIKPKKCIEKDYLANFLRGTYFQKELLKNSSGSTAQGIQRQKLDQIVIFFPKTIEEQTRIANVLSDMDAEITALENKHTKYKQIKQGMMQNLLTGRIRLV